MGNLLRKFILKSALSVVLTALFFSTFVSQVRAENKTVNVYMFYGTGCPHCAKEIDFLKDISAENNDDVKIYSYEIYYDRANSELFNQVAEFVELEVGGVPLIIIGDEPIIGYGSDATTGQDIKNRIDYCLNNQCDDLVANIINPKEEDKLFGTKEVENQTEINYEKSDGKKYPEEIELPVFGKINLVNFSLPVITIIIAFMDGFNPCAMWILIFLITMLINMKDKKKLYILGTVFIVTSALVYFVFLSAWFNFFQFVGYVYWIKIVIGLVALTTGVFHLKNAFTSKGECHVTNSKQRASIMESIKKIIKENNLWIAVAGMIILAISVNFIEVVCSAGLPAVYTSLLASANLSTFKYYLYLILYTAIFMFDDLFIFFIAVKTFHAVGITSKYSKYSGIIGGALMLVIGLILILKPELLMFG